MQNAFGTHPRHFCFAAKHRNFRLLCRQKTKIPQPDFFAAFY